METPTKTWRTQKNVANTKNNLAQHKKNMEKQFFLVETTKNKEKQKNVDTPTDTFRHDGETKNNWRHYTETMATQRRTPSTSGNTEETDREAKNRKFKTKKIYKRSCESPDTHQKVA